MRFVCFDKFLQHVVAPAYKGNVNLLIHWRWVRSL